MSKFTVDTHLFRELGELLVSRESTALVELVKNSYDADARKVVVHGERLGEPEHAKIIITDDGNGMTPVVFEAGFLRIASRNKEKNERRSPIFSRRFTGAKGVGRLAAHKLAWKIHIVSTPAKQVFGAKAEGVEAIIDWKLVESVDSLDEVEKTNGIRVKNLAASADKRHGTQITLSNLKRRWSPKQRSDFFGEIDSFLPPAPLLVNPSKQTIGVPLFDAPKVRDEGKRASAFEVIRTGDLDVGDDQLANALSSSDWIIDMDCDPKKGVATIRLMPTRKFAKEFNKARPRTFHVPLDASADVGFQARILYQADKSWARPGVRIYQEGFRVLPYGESRNDWLELDEDYKRRGRTLRFLDQVPGLADASTEQDPNQGLSLSGNSSYLGAVFLTAEASKSLRMLVNREGFEWSSSFEEMKRLVRVALDLCVRERATYTLVKREQRRQVRKTENQKQNVALPAGSLTILDDVEEARKQVARAEAFTSSGNQKAAIAAVAAGVAAVSRASQASEELVGDIQTTRLLAALGLQLTAYVHEVNALLVSTRQIAELSSELRKLVTGIAKTKAIQVDSKLADLHRAIEKQAQYLADVTSPDARRRRSKQRIADRFDAAARLYEPEAARRGISIENKIDPELKTPEPMFGAELMLVFANLLSNAIKAAGKRGRIRVTSRHVADSLLIRIENTGVRVELNDGERWFKPFESTTASSDVYLGHGLGMGLPITRELLEDYGATVRFAKSSPGFSTAIEIRLPVQ